MLTDEELIQGLRSALERHSAGVVPPPDLLARVHGELRGSPQAQRPRRRAAGHVPRLRLARLAPVVALLVVVVVVAAFLGAQGRKPAGTRPTHSAAAASTLSALEAKLAILRRPQTAADRRFNGYLPISRRGRFGFIPGLTRLAATLQVQGLGEANVLLLVQRSMFGFSNTGIIKAPGGAPIAMAAVMSDGKMVNGTEPLESTALAQPGLVGWGLGSGMIGPGPFPQSNLAVAVGVVPDGVARVKWTFTGAYFGILHPRPVTLYPQIQNNVAVAAAPRTAGPLADAVWYGAGGRRIASGGAAQSREELHQINAFNASRNVPIAPLLLSHYSLFSAVAPEDPTQGPLFVLFGAQGRLNFWQVRYIPTVTGLHGRGLWVVPGANGFCISDPRGGVCGSLRPQDASRIIGIATTSGSKETLSGLVPDGNRTVTMVLQSGARAIAPVVDHNVFEVTVRGRIVAIINRDAQGRVTQYRVAGGHG